VRHDSRRRLRRIDFAGAAARATGGVVEEIVRLIGADATETSSNSTRRRNVVATTGLFGGSISWRTDSSRVKGALERRANVSLSSSLESPSLQSRSDRRRARVRYHVDGDRLFNANTSSELVTSRMHRRLFGRESTLRTHSSATLWSSVS